MYHDCICMMSLRQSCLAPVQRIACSLLSPHFSTMTTVRPPLLACNVYISEGQNDECIRRLEAEARDKDSSTSALVHVFQDRPYNRTGFTLAGQTASVHEAALAIVGASIRAIDLSRQSGSHPRIGAVDHVSVHPLQDASLSEAGAAAASLARDIGSLLQVPTFLYGAAHPIGRSLAEVRRSLGYFKSDDKGMWTDATNNINLRLSPDFGPHHVSPKTGCVAIGAVKYVLNLNIQIATSDLSLAKQFARVISERGGGLPSVQAMALTHGPNEVEIACNLLDPTASSKEDVVAKVKELCATNNVVVLGSYSPSFNPELALEHLKQAQSFD